MAFLKLFTPVFFAIFLILSDYRFSYLDEIKASIAKLVSPIYLLVNLPSQLYIWIDEQGIDKQTLISQNEQLRNELTRLKVNLQNYNALLLENQKLTQLLGSSYQINNANFILARVSSISQSRLKKQLVVNKGSTHGVKVGQSVLGVNGVIGQITQVNPYHATLLMIADPTQHIPVKNQRNGIRGISKGVASQAEKLSLNFIEVGLDIQLGDTFVSSAAGEKFPEGYPVGQVTHVEQQENDPFLQIELKPLQTTEQLEFVLINNTQP